MSKIIGRIEEVKVLEDAYLSNRPEFIALYGRRRVGKTFLIRTIYQNRFLFQLTGIANSSLENQLNNFNNALKKQHPKMKLKPAKTWFEAFGELSKLIQKSKQTKKVIFMDELPWLDTPSSNFIQALEHFWNSFASARKDVLLVVCGSAASWMLNELINSKGGLHNRITQRLRIDPFTLSECELFIKSKKITLEKYQLVQLYMAFGGIPFYWDEVKKGLSAQQNIEAICFSKNGLLRTEFTNLFKALFNKDDKHQMVVELLAKKAIGLSREEIIKQGKLSNGGSVTRLLNELEESGFIKKYIPYGKKMRNSLYQLSDFYTLFYCRFIKNNAIDNKNYWTNTIDSPSHRAWSGYAFEQLCLYHVDEIKKALGIWGVNSEACSWRSTKFSSKAQIDLLIDRRDGVINLCEIKFSINQFSINKRYDAELRNKVGIFKAETNTRKAVFLTLITTFGIAQNRYSGNVQNDLNMQLFFNS
jgi:uncharacterized protein